MFACVPPRPAYLAVLLLGLWATAARAQGQPDPTPLPADEIIRVSTELVQTDVIVFDKQGHFVDNLRPEDFDLRVDGRAQTVSFFERVRAGSVNEEAQLAAARGGRGRSAAAINAAVQPLDRGRFIFFFIDDLHLAPASLVRTRALLTQFIDEQLGQNDQVAISTASGQIGFLQQLTDDKDVLHAAVKRLTYRELTVRDNSSPQMSATDALRIQGNDITVVNAFVDAVLREQPPAGIVNGTTAAARGIAENQIRGRAAQLLQQNTAVSTQTLASLQTLMRTTAQLPGRKLVYFISDGFVIDINQNDTHDRIRRVTDAAVRAGVVVYTLDARGLSAALTGISDASSAMVDPTGRLSSGGNETSTMQEPLRVIAGETGGRALLNNNALTHAITQALAETSVYYLLAWRPEQDEVRSGRYRRIEVSVKQHPELTVLVQRGFFTTLPADTTAPRKRDETKHNNKRPEADNGTASAGPQAAGVPVANAINPALVAALTSFAPRTALPTALTLNYFNTTQYGLLLVSSLQIMADPPPPNQSRHIDVLGGIYDEQGHAVNTFERHVTITPKSATSSAAPQPASAAPERVIMTHQSRIAPGLYQVRIGTHEIESGRTGSATQWITIPALDASKLALSSIFLGERPRATESANAQAAPAQAIVNPERRFSRASVLRFVLYVYNAAHTGQTGAPDVALQLQIFRDDQPVITTPLRKVQTDGLPDFSVLPYAAELDLGDLPAGRYILQAAAIDRTAKTSVTQRVKFTVE
jgi:VWFA-related protein